MEKHTEPNKENMYKNKNKNLRRNEENSTDYKLKIQKIIVSDYL